MANDSIPPAVVAEIKAEAVHPGPAEISNLTVSLDAMSKMQLEAVGHALPAINKEIAATNPGLPGLALEWSGGSNADGSKTNTDILLVKPGANGQSTELYHREFTTDHGSESDIKFDLLTHQQRSAEAIADPHGAGSQAPEQATAAEVVQPSTKAALMAAMEKGGPNEMAALAKNLDGLNQEQLRALQPFVQDLDRAEHWVHPGLAPLEVGMAGSGNSSGYSDQVFRIQQQTKPGEYKTLYNREFETDNGSQTDIKFNLATGKVASMDTTTPNLPPMHIEVHPADKK